MKSLLLTLLLALTLAFDSAQALTLDNEEVIGHLQNTVYSLMHKGESGRLHINGGSYGSCKMSIVKDDLRNAHIVSIVSNGKTVAEMIIGSLKTVLKGSVINNKSGTRIISAYTQNPMPSLRFESFYLGHVGRSTTLALTQQLQNWQKRTVMCSF